MSRARPDYFKLWERVNPSDSPKEGGHGRGFVVRRVNSSDARLYFLKALKNNESHDRRSRFKSEVNALKRLKHQLIAKIVDDNVDKYCDRAVQLYYVSEYYEGGSLRELVETKGVLNLEESLRIVMSLLNTLAYCHSEQVVHRDIKPDNVVLNSEQSPVLIDFGQAWLEESHNSSLLTPTVQHMGNRFLVLPECTTNDTDIFAKRDKRSDVTLAAALLLYLLTGVEPSSLVDAEGNMPHQRSKSRETLMELNDPLKGRLMRIFDKAFQQQINLRFNSADALRSELDMLQESERAEAPYDLVAGLNELKLTPTYQLRKQSMAVLDNISDSLRYSVEEYGRRILRNQFQFDTVQSVRSPEEVSFYVDARHRVIPEICLKVKIVFRAVGTEIVVETSSGEVVEQLYRCRFDEYESSIEFQGVFKSYLERVLSDVVRTAST